MAPIRLQKYFTDCGVMSRRAAEEQIRLGKVRVNGVIASVGDTVEPGIDKVELGGKIIIPMTEENVCIMLNKPRGYVTTMSDEKGRKNVSELVCDLGMRVYPIGRLDMDSDGLLLLTNNGDLANKLTHPRHEIPKIYRVSVKGNPTAEQLKQLGSEMKIDGYKILPVKVEVISRARTADESSVLQMTLYEGRNRQIRKMCDAVGLKIRRLSRVSIGKIALGSLTPGKWRRLTKKEIDYLISDKENLT
ncbi:MAG: rRNA pseudouridine synthase [Ruminococcaceae bacterium]|nr:rRNA pseudouridine synthase [Oscillospiraceae bacterium]